MVFFPHFFKFSRPTRPLQPTLLALFFFSLFLTVTILISRIFKPKYQNRPASPYAPLDYQPVIFAFRSQFCVFFFCLPPGLACLSTPTVIPPVFVFFPMSMTPFGELPPCMVLPHPSITFLPSLFLETPFYYNSILLRPPPQHFRITLSSPQCVLHGFFFICFFLSA